MSADFEIQRATELPARNFPWNDEDGNPIDFTTGWTFTLTLALTTATTSALVKTSGLTGYDGGVTMTPTLNEFDLAVGTYRAWLVAKRTADNFERPYPDPPVFIEITAGPPAAP